MEHQSGRRKFLQNSALALAIPTIPKEILAQTILNRRLEWKTFRTTTQYDTLLKTISAMKANTNSASPASWDYWVNIHLNRCPHGKPYFLAWHRGYLYYFERQLRTISGNPRLVLPYWDYYSYSTLPPEFTDTNSPLYEPRVNTNVRQALTLAPFSSRLTNFPIGASNAFEPSIETAPHNQLHNIIGNVMSTMRSPVDPIFWLHHGNIDRLWVAWVAAGGGRQMPVINSSYWSGSHIYTTTLSIARRSTYDTRKLLLYYYQNETFPTSLPLAQTSSKEKFLRAQASSENLLRTAPPVGAFKLSNPGLTRDGAFSVGGALNIGLERRSVSAQIPVSSVHWQGIQQIGAGRAFSLPNSSKAYRSFKLVLDSAELSDAGRNGGYFYQIYLSIPSSGEATGALPMLLGTLGPFEINAASHHGPAQLKFPIDARLIAMSKLRSGMVTVSFVRVDGDNSPSGPAIGIGEVRLELSSE